MGQDSPGYLLNEADKIHVEPVENLMIMDPVAKADA